MNGINREDSNGEEIDSKAKTWVTSFKTLYQTKDVTPYMSQFIHLYGNLVAFMQQGLEKLNYTTTKQFQHSTNPWNVTSVMQILEKQNHIEMLEDNHFSVKKLASDFGNLSCARPWYGLTDERSSNGKGSFDDGEILDAAVFIDCKEFIDDEGLIDNLSTNDKEPLDEGRSTDGKGSPDDGGRSTDGKGSADNGGIIEDG